MEDLETFRKEVYPVLISRGVEPPKPDSEAEKEQFERWRRGKGRISDGRESRE